MSSSEQIHTQAIVCRPPQDGERKWVLETVSLSPPADDEIVVEMIATGVCHTDIVCGSLPDEALQLGLPTYPRVLGHEGLKSKPSLLLHALMADFMSNRGWHRQVYRVEGHQGQRGRQGPHILLILQAVPQLPIRCSRVLPQVGRNQLQWQQRRLFQLGGKEY